MLVQAHVSVCQVKKTRLVPAVRECQAIFCNKKGTWTTITVILHRAPTPFGGTAGTVRTLPLPGFEMLQAHTEPHLTWDRMCHRPNFNRTPRGWSIQYAAESPDLWSWHTQLFCQTTIEDWISEGCLNCYCKLWAEPLWAIKYQFKVYIHCLLTCLHNRSHNISKCEASLM